MTFQENDLSDRIVEYLRKRREPSSLSEVKFAVGASLTDTATAISKLVRDGSVLADAEPPRGRVYYRIRRSV